MAQTHKIIQRSAQFFDDLTRKNPHLSLPVTNRLMKSNDSTVLKIQSEILSGNSEETGNGTAIICHSRVLPAIDRYLAHKKAWGSTIEKEYYSTLSAHEFIQHLMRDRPLMFMGGGDSTLLRDGVTRFIGALRDWDLVGTENESNRIKLGGHLSYHDMQFSALMGASSLTSFINSGSRHNCGTPGKPGMFNPRGIYIGLVGARFERWCRMESEYCLVSEACSASNGFGPLSQAPETDAKDRLSVWASLLNVPHFPTLDEVLEQRQLLPKTEFDKKYLTLSDKKYLNVEVYYQRMLITAELFLKEANRRAQQESTQAYLHMVGLGLGVWQLHPDQNQIFVNAFGQAIKSLDLPHIATLDFSYINGVDKCLDAANLGHITSSAGNSIEIRFSHRNPADVLEDPKQLLVACYAWDSNSYPGNEYWSGSLSGSGDPAAASCSNISELQNPQVNPGFLNSVVVL